MWVYVSNFIKQFPITLELVLVVCAVDWSLKEDEVFKMKFRNGFRIRIILKLNWTFQIVWSILQFPRVVYFVELKYDFLALPQHKSKTSLETDSKSSNLIIKWGTIPSNLNKLKIITLFTFLEFRLSGRGNEAGCSKPRYEGGNCPKDETSQSVRPHFHSLC